LAGHDRAIGQRVVGTERDIGLLNADQLEDVPHRRGRSIVRLSLVELARPADPSGTGVLVLAGSSGRVDQQRAKLLASHGALAASMQWFGGPGMQPGSWDVPIESFMDALDELAPEVDRLAI